MHIRQPGVGRQRLLVLRDRLVVAAKRLQQHADGGTGPHVGRVGGKRPLVLDYRRFGAPQCLQRGAEVVSHGGNVRFDLKRRFV
jgi:hypothetical protein